MPKTELSVAPSTKPKQKALTEEEIDRLLDIYLSYLAIEEGAVSSEASSPLYRLIRREFGSFLWDAGLITS